MELPISRSIPEKMIYEKSLKSVMDTYRRARFLHEVVVNKPNMHQAELLKIAQKERKWAPETSMAAIRYMIERNWLVKENIGQNVFFRSASPQLVTELVLRDEVKEREEELAGLEREFANYSHVEKLRASAHVVDNLLDLLNLVILKETMEESGKRMHERYEIKIRALLERLFAFIRTSDEFDSRAVLRAIAQQHFLAGGYSVLNTQKYAPRGGDPQYRSIRQAEGLRG